MNARLAAALVCLVVACACGGSKPLTPMDVSEFESNVLGELIVRSRLTGTMRTLMTIGVQSQGESSEVRSILYYRSPDSFRIDGLDPLGAPVIVVRATDGEVSLTYVRHNEVIRGPLSDGLLKNLYGMDIRVSDVRRAIFANPFTDGRLSRGEVGTRDGLIVVTRPAERAGHVEEIHIDRVNGEPVVTEWWVRTTNGVETLHARFWNYREVGGILRPMDAMIERRRENARMTFHATEPEVNLELSDATFAHLFPPGANVKWVDDEGRLVKRTGEGEGQPLP